jgi:hypothetical protein
VFKERQEPQIRITSNYALAKPAHVLGDATPAIVIPDKLTHQITNAADLFVVPARGAVGHSETGWAQARRQHASHSGQFGGRLGADRARCESARLCCHERPLAAELNFAANVSLSAIK